MKALPAATQCGVERGEKRLQFSLKTLLLLVIIGAACGIIVMQQYELSVLRKRNAELEADVTTAKKQMAFWQEMHDRQSEVVDFATTELINLKIETGRLPAAKPMDRIKDKSTKNNGD